jgi:hypothetical protein
MDAEWPAYVTHMESFVSELVLSIELAVAKKIPEKGTN